MTAVFFSSLPAAFIVATHSVNESITAGIIIFAVGIVVGLASVLVADILTRRKINRAYDEWVAAGKPERRLVDRRRRRRNAAA